MIGELLGPYRIDRELGSGGMGKVYAATVAGRCPGLSEGTVVALKVVHPHLVETEGFFRRFLQEAQIGASIQHENVVRTYMADAIAVGGVQQNFLVMEYVEGQTLRALLEELERVPEELCRHIGREVAKGLAAIHEAGVVHRDVKPENVLITAENAVKIMDLGVARLAEESIRLSRTGMFVGSIEYAAPEQFEKGGKGADGRADLHALGVVLYELATGQHPYRDEDVKKVLRNIIDSQPRKAGELNPQLSPFFEELVRRLMAKKREDRFAAAAELADVLEEGEASAWWKERAKALRIETKRPLRRIRIPRETALYGRDAELEELHALFESAKSGEGRVVLVEGEAGIGKTRLVDEFVGRLRESGEDVNFLFGSYPPGGAATAAGAWSTAYREQFGEAGLEETLEAYLEPTPVLIPAFAALLRGETTPTGCEPLTKDSLQTCFVHATRALAAERPTIVLIDDLHFAPEEGRGMFAALGLAVPGHRILLVGTTRPRIPEEWAASLQRMETKRLSLTRLGPKDLTSLLKDAFRSERLVQELGIKIAEKSDGNPFFAFEIIRGLREGQFLSQREDGTWVTTRVIGDIQIPSSVLDLVNARVADLTEEERDLLDVACCWGFQFDPGLVGEVLGISRIPLLKRFGQIERKHRLVRAAGRDYVFDHHQVQEALYGSLHEQMREEYHASLAEALETRTQAADKDPGTLDGALCVDLSEHFLAGARGERALRYLDPALSHLKKGYLNDHAIRLADRALAVPGLLAGKERIEVLLRKAGRLELLGRPEVERAALDEALELADQDSDPSLRSRTRNGLGWHLCRVSRYAEAETVVGAAVDLARGVGDKKQETVATELLGNVSTHLGRYAEAQERHERSLALAREIGDRRGEASATGSLGSVFYSLGRYAEAQSQYERHFALAREIGDRKGEASATGNLGIVLSRLGRYAEAQAQYERSLALAREIGYRHGEATATVNLGNAFLRLGRYAEARARFERGLALLREIGDRQSEATTMHNLGNVFKFLGRYPEAQSQYERALALSREIGDQVGEAGATVGLGNVFHLLGRYAEAQAQDERWLALSREIGDRSGEAGATVNLGNTFHSLGRFAAAKEHYERSLALSREIGEREREGIALVNLGPLQAELGRVDHALATLEQSLRVLRVIGARRPEGYALHRLGDLYEQMGDLEKAQRYYEEGLALRREISYQSGVAETLTALGKLESRLGKSETAASHLDEAIALAREMDLPGVILRASAERARLPGSDGAAALEAFAEYGDRADRLSRMAARFRLWQITGDLTHLEEAKRLLDEFVANSPEEDRETMIANVPLHREVIQAWNESQRLC